MAIPPKASAPGGCSSSYSGSFGIAVVSITSSSNITSTTMKSITPVTTSAPVITPTIIISSTAHSAAPVSQISDGQPQVATTLASISVQPVSQISDGQPQVATTPARVSVQPVSQISDGQPQVATTRAPMSVQIVSQISDGQIQAPTTATIPPVSQISDGQIQAPGSTLCTSTVSAVSQISDGQPQAPYHTIASKVKRYAFPQATPSSSPQLVGCASNGTLTLTLDNGVLKDGQGRTGYIASNYQFQFDNPPQAGAIYTSGFSVCSNGSLALGGSAVWYQCLSGQFYNLYDRYWAPQCHAVLIDVLLLKNCS